MAPTEPTIGAAASGGRLARRRSAGARGRLESGGRRLGDFPRARHRLRRARPADAWSRPPRRCHTAISPGSAWCWLRGEHRRHGLGTRLLKRCVAALGAGAACPCSTPRRRAARSIARSASRTPGVFTDWRDRIRDLCRDAPPPPAARSFARSPTPTGMRFAPMTQRPSAPTAARCCSACAGGCRRRIDRASGTAASRALCSAATAAARRRSGRSSRRTMTPRVRCSRARSPPSKARSISISPTPRPGSAHGSRNVALSAQRPLTRMLLRRGDGFRRCGAHVRRGRSGVRLKAKGRPRCGRPWQSLYSAQYSFGGLIGGILTLLSRNSLV